VNRAGELATLELPLDSFGEKWVAGDFVDDPLSLALRVQCANVGAYPGFERGKTG